MHETGLKVFPYAYMLGMRYRRFQSKSALEHFSLKMLWLLRKQEPAAKVQAQLACVVKHRSVRSTKRLFM